MLSLLAGDVTAEALAARHGLSLEEIDSSRRWYVAGLRRSTTHRGRRLAVMTVAVCAALFLAPLALGQSCPQTLPGPLVTMCPDAPALANEVNGNFGQLVTWLQQKVGPVGNQNVTVNGTLTTNGALTANSGVSVTGAVSATTVSALGTISTSGLVSATSLNVSAGINAGSISPSTLVPGAVLGGGTVRCNGNSSIRRDCAAWGVGSCPAGCGGIQCSRGTPRGVADGACFTTADGQGGYCYHALCVQ